MNRGIVHALVFAMGGAIWCGRLFQKSLPPKVPQSAHVAFDPEEVNRSLRQLERRAHDDPQGATGLGLLAQSYLRRQREQGDPDDLLRAEAAARKSVAARKYNNPIGSSALSRALIGQHRFAEAERIALRIGDIGLAGECALERGDYLRARKWLGDASVASPDDPGIRVSQARLFELTGDIERAEATYRSALSKMEESYATPAPTRAWFRTRLGLFLATYRSHDEARTELESANEIFVNPQTTLALARLSASEGDWTECARLAREIALPEATMLLADAERALGNLDAAQAAQTRLLSETGGRHVHGRSLALFLADHDLAPELAVQLMEPEWQSRKDVETAEALAWVYFKAGRLLEAKSLVEHARKWGYVAPTFLTRARRIAEYSSANIPKEKRNDPKNPRLYTRRIIDRGRDRRHSRLDPLSGLRTSSREGAANELPVESPTARSGRPTVYERL